MPYTGKPSGACLTCRNRRIKCDETRPSCLKCHNSNRTCLGYKDPSQVKFRDMTAMTIQRYKSTAEESSTSSPDSHSHNDPDRLHRSVSPGKSDGLQDSDTIPNYGVLAFATKSSRQDRGRKMIKAESTNERLWQYREATKLLPPPPVSVNQHAISYLFSAYLGAANHYLDSGFSGVLETIVQKGKPPRYLSAAISATSIAAFSRRPNARPLAIRAEKVYSQALVEVNKALRQASAIQNDELLAAILILALYEMFMSNHFTGYYNHILGAATILKNRPNGPFTTATGAMAFILTRNEIMKTVLLTPLSSIERDLNPWKQWLHALGLDKWTLSARSHMPASVMSGPLMHYKALLYQAMEDSAIGASTASSSPLSGVSSHPSPDDSRSEQDSICDSNTPATPPPGTDTLIPGLEYLTGVLRQFLDTKARFAQVDRTISELYNMGAAPPQPIPAGMVREVDGWVLFIDSPIYVYSSMLHAGFRLAMTLTYLDPATKAALLVSSVPEPASHGLRQMNEFQELSAGGERAVAEIVGSVPYLCGLLPSSMTGKSSSRELLDVAGIRDAQAISFAIWAMAAAIMSPFTTSAQSEYLLGMLRYCHQVKGIGQAAALHEACMELVRRGTSTSPPACASPIPAAWMGRGTSLEGLIYGVKTEAT
ncbi:hypothetical protein Micbo1qcDRAFT_199197 [Microdochium bolleyi]|uniref:Zn(2)-C6 fungal-type domain-containing protein n=1 Tax=Microdochium bolleyi TaxID=196109 RepID=A0A136JH08_9PEZI|nr:hypothetical protein Micbo1qcDRAFT_199197 [Microdochium bolleyi]